MKLFLDIQNEVLKEALFEIFENQEGFQMVFASEEADSIISDHDVLHKKTICLDDITPLTIESLLKLLEKQKSQETFSIHHFTYNPRLRHLTDTTTQSTQKLTEKEAALLLYFVKQKGQEVSRDVLIKDIWNYLEDVDSHTLETHIYLLRQKIEEDPKSPELLVTTPGGYVLRL